MFHLTASRRFAVLNLLIPVNAFVVLGDFQTGRASVDPIVDSAEVRIPLDGFLVHDAKATGIAVTTTLSSARIRFADSVTSWAFAGVAVTE